ncbi:regulatory protein, luxR family [Georgenia satyanarayanai]|uniref:Regulatory protein, luxR family n=1 Tax=Georgenia satyanarayanai TaxID=860221 RepID=A0A2Y9C308_9MICO|nr:LuxR family transcriptional regulator [Georgenia satyanarayanai]PYG02174.1 regulatory LuxR family protein [Georgenia satyanarayanai]SSA36993.1 regulatory protein, luxR family [Georgenia satyanarayanai]
MRDLVGRTAELDLLRTEVGGAAQRVGVFLHGPPGIGKTALLRCAQELAHDTGMTTLECAGAASEAHVPYAGLHQLLQPLLGDVPDGDHRFTLLRRSVGALDAAADAPDPVAVALATLGLLRAAAATRPLLLAVDDVHWLDPSTVRVLAFVARRIRGDPVLLVCTSRVPPESALTDVLFRTVALEPLDGPGALSLVRAHAPDLPPALRDRLLREAEGNPLALVELARAWRRIPGGTVVTDPLPLTDRLETVFADRVAALPAVGQDLLLLASLTQRTRGASGTGTVTELITAARHLGHAAAAAADLEPAEAADLLDVRVPGVHFRHPLIRSAVARTAGESRRRGGHAALARSATDPDRAVWHRACAATEPDEEVAAALERCADRVRRRGAVRESVEMLERSAALTPDPATRGGRLVTAADHAADLGHEEAVDRLLAEAHELPLTEVDRARAEWRRYRPPEVIGDYTRMRELVTALARLHAAGRQDTALDALAPAAEIAYWRGIEPRCRDLFCGAVEGLVAAPDPRVLTALALSAPVSQARRVRAGIAALGVHTVDDAETLALVGRAAAVVGDAEAATALLLRSVEGLRQQGRLGMLTTANATLAWTCWHLGRWEEAATAARDARQSGLERGRARVAAEVMSSALDAVRADPGAALDRCTRVDGALSATPSATLREMSAFARTTALLVLGRDQEAWDVIQERFTSTDTRPLAESVTSIQHGTLPVYVDAAARVGAVADARAVVARFAGGGADSPLLTASLVYSRAVLAAPEAAESLHRAAVDALAGWPFLRARVRLSLGRLLRRERRVTESRPHLRAARDSFDTLGALAWAAAARRELRAAGEADGHDASTGAPLLTAQEQLIAALAAQGLTNREIGARLYLSPRTVGSHLYHLFPKLGVTSRAQLGQVMPSVDRRPLP